MRVTNAGPSPIQDFVPELLAEIFILSLPNPEFARLIRQQSPLNVSQVCRSWRKTALSFCKLWSGLHIVCHDEDYVLDANAAVHKWLERSGSVGFRLHIEEPDVQRSCVSWPVLKTVFQCTLDHPGRLTTLSIWLDDDYLEKVSDFIGRHIFSLKRLHIVTGAADHINADRMRMVHTRLAETFGRLSELRFVYRVRHAPTFANVVSPLKLPICLNLRRLQLDCYISPKQLCSILEKCPSVEVVDLTGLTHGPTHLPAFKIFMSIRSFTYVSHVEDPALLLVVLGFLGMPSLLHLKLEVRTGLQFPYPEEGVNKGELESFLTQSKPPLRSLHIDCKYIYAAELLRSLQLCPFLSRLRMPMTNDIARALILPAQVTDGDALICPLLEELEVTFPDLDLPDAQELFVALADMVRSRWRTPNSPNTLATGIAQPKVASIQVPRRLLRLTIPSLDIKRHPLYSSIKDCIRQGFVLDSI